MKAAEALAMTRAFVDEDGEDIKLRRIPATDVDCRAHVRSPTTEELIGGITQDQLVCTLTPIEIDAAVWPQAVTGTTDDPRIPSKNRGDRAFVRGHWRSVQWGQGKYLQGVLVRIEMRVLG